MRSDPIDQYEWDVTHYLALVVQIGLVSLLLILGPLIVLKARGHSLRASGPLALYFFAIGVGFILIEIGLMQKCTLFLGHPNYSISTILFSLLVFSGIGSYTSGRWPLTPRATIAVASAAIICLVLAFAAFSQPLFEAALGLPIETRIAIAVSTLAPKAFFMGMMFPTCLRMAEERVPDFSPWVWGVNGFASVLGSLATIPLTIALGFNRTLLLAAIAYGLAWLSFELFRWRTTR
jgi:predicted membrane-bound spermidine synthase